MKIYLPSKIVLPPIGAGAPLSSVTTKIREATRNAKSVLPAGFLSSPWRIVDKSSPGALRVRPFCPGLMRGLETSKRMVLGGRFKCIVMNDAGEAIREYPWQRNLIYNLGLDNICNVRTIVASFTHAVSGVGTGDTKRDSGAITASQSSTTVTASAAFFVAGDVGNMIKWDSGEESRITSFSSDTSVDVTPAQAVSSGQFSVHETNDPQMSNEHARTSTYLTGAGNCGVTIVSDVLTMRRTYDFAAEVSGVTIREIGTSHTASTAANLFNRVFLNTPVALLTGQALRVVFDLDITCAPATPQAVSAAISGWPEAPASTTDGDQVWTGVCLSGPDPTDGSNGDAIDSAGINGNGQSMEPSVNAHFGLNSSSAALSNFNTATGSINGTSIYAAVGSLNTYNTLDFFRQKIFDVPLGSGNATNIRRLLWGGPAGTPPGLANRRGMELLFDEDQTKVNTHTLQLIFRMTTGRTLTN